MTWLNLKRRTSRAEHQVQPSAEGHCIYPLLLTPRVKLPASSMTPCAAVAQGIFIKNKKIVPDFKNNNLLYIKLYLKLKKSII